MTLLTFCLAALVVLLVPGPGVLYVVTRTLSQGLAAGVASVLGLASGAFVHVLAATAGLSAVLLASATAFGVVKTLGVAYLVYLGIRTILSRSSPSTAPEHQDAALRQVFWEGVLVSVLNPKIAVFFLAFLPQFVMTEPGDAGWQVLFLGSVYVVLAVCTDGAYALCAHRVRRVLSDRFVYGPVPRLASGVAYLGLGVSVLVAERGD
ncbi:MAG: LysE family translocator [Pseudomonadota bacterium]